MWPKLVRYAGEHKVKIAIENCPMIFSDDEWPGGLNLAYSPAIWREMFRIIPDANFGLNLDPSHLLWQQIDYARVIQDFGERIFHVHAVHCSSSVRRVSVPAPTCPISSRPYNPGRVTATPLLSTFYFYFLLPDSSTP